ncbi:MAG: hypothetical protein JNJ45_06950 [Chthonomonas sp.]|nr:hypothetical protein [Chthonomonas sp.]
MDYGTLKIVTGVLVTIGLYSVLYRENKFYRLVEHIFLGLASGFAIISYWKETVRTDWYDQAFGRVGETAADTQPAFWMYAALLPIAMMGYMAFSKKNAWMSRIPILIIIGLWAGQQIQVFNNGWIPQLLNTMQPIYPTNMTRFTVPGTAGLSNADITRIGAEVYPSEALTNLALVITFITVLSYFFFSFDLKNKFIASTNKLGRYILMVGLGAIFGSTVLMRFTLVIDRLFYIFIEFFKRTVFKME